MNTPPNALPESSFDSPGIPPAPTSATRPLYWSVRRELWENRFITVAPLAVTAFVLFASLISLIGLPRRIRSLPTLEPAKQHAVVVRPFSLAPAPIMLATFLVAVFYCLDALHGERRDRSILFFKSLPVSDLTTVLSKASIPLAVLPLIAFVLSVATQVVMLQAGTAIMLARGVSPARLWAEFRFFQEPVINFYGLTVHVLWFAPIYGWLLLVSAWARRATFLWAVLPFLAISAVERIVFNTTHFLSFLKYRFTGAMVEAFTFVPEHGTDATLDQLTQLDPVRFLSSSGLWIGLAFTGACLAGAVRLRRYREPI